MIKQRIKQFFIVGVMAQTLTACLMTRTDVREAEQGRVMQEQLMSLQQVNAESTNRYNELNYEIRQIHGRVEVLEAKAGAGEQSSKARAEQSQNLESRLGLMQEALIKLENQMSAMSAELASIKAAGRAASSNPTSSQKKNLYELAEVEFSKKNWKEAILNYQRYRDTNPKGKSFADATYKTGVSFQELGMKDEAKAFYEEVIAKFPQSESAKRAQSRLSRLK